MATGLQGTAELERESLRGSLRERDRARERERERERGGERERESSGTGFLFEEPNPTGSRPSDLIGL